MAGLKEGGVDQVLNAASAATGEGDYVGPVFGRDEEVEDVRGIYVNYNDDGRQSRGDARSAKPYVAGIHGFHPG
jgi:hypothetical protein